MKRMIRSKKLARGYTAMEVIIAMTLFAIGGAGVIAMERAAIQSNQDARNLDIASAIGREWVERLRRDGSSWGLDDGTGNPILVGAPQFKWLKAPEVVNAGGPACAPSTASCWRVPPAANGKVGERYTFDVLGREVDNNDPTIKFCVQYRLEVVQHDPPGDALVTSATSIRVDVRVLWSRALTQVNTGPVPTFCTDQAQDGTRVEQMVVTSVIRRNAS